MKDIDTLKEADRYCYDTINIDYLRTRMLLQDWLKANKRTRARIDPSMDLHGHDYPPGHPRLFAFIPKPWQYHPEKGVYVIADPNNLAWADVEYTREDKYQLKENTYHPEYANNRYYVVYPGDFKKLWQPLPWNHLRMQVWEVDMYYQHRQYIGHDGKPFSKHLTQFDLIHMHIWEPKIDPHWTEDYKVQVQREYELSRAAAIGEHEQYGKQWAIPERHQAVMEIRKFFPDYQPNASLMEGKYQDHPAWQWIEPYRWYYRYATLADQEHDPIFALKNKQK